MAMLIRSLPFTRERLPGASNCPFSPVLDLRGSNWRKRHTFLCIIKKKAGRRAGRLIIPSARLGHVGRGWWLDRPIARGTREAKAVQGQESEWPRRDTSRGEAY